jgi:hypothetical protein
VEHRTPFVPSSQYVLFGGRVLAPFDPLVHGVVPFDFSSGPFWNFPLHCGLQIIMQQPPKQRPGKKKSRARLLQETLNEMSIAELCDLLTDIEAKIGEVVKLPKADK